MLREDVRLKNLYDTPEGKQCLKMRPACNRVLAEVFDISESDIIRFEQEDGPHILDVEFAIDLKLAMPCGAQLSGQEKALSNHFYSFRTFTIEFYQNRFTKELGEFFKIASQFYLSGYSDRTGIEFVEWHIIKMFDFINWIKYQSIESLAKKCKPSTSRANFLPIYYKDIPTRLYFASGGGPGFTHIYGDAQSLARQTSPSPF